MPPSPRNLALSFSILSDAKRDVSRAYGVFDEQNVVARRTTFVIDRAGIVQQVFMAQQPLIRLKHSRPALCSPKLSNTESLPTRTPFRRGPAAGGPPHPLLPSDHPEQCEL